MTGSCLVPSPNCEVRLFISWGKVETASVSTWGKPRMYVKYQLRQQCQSEYEGILTAREVEDRGAGWMGRRGRLTLEMHLSPLPLALVPDHWRVNIPTVGVVHKKMGRNIRSVDIASLWILAGGVGMGFTRLLVLWKYQVQCTTQERSWRTQFAQIPTRWLHDTSVYAPKLQNTETLHSSI